MRRLFSFLRFWPWAVLVGAAVFFAFDYIPRVFWARIDTEVVVLPLLYQDLVVQHHAFADWGWGGFSALFPDIGLFFILNYLVQDGLWAAQLFLICYFLFWLLASVNLAFVFHRPHKLALCSFLLLFWVSVICNFGLPDDWGVYLQNPILQPIFHAGTGLMCLVCLGLLFRQVQGIHTIGLVALIVFSFLAAVSDALFLVVFFVPATAAMLVLTVAFWRQWPRYLGLTLAVGGTGVAAHYLAPYFFPVRVSTDVYVVLGLDRLHASFFQVVADLQSQNHHLFVFLVALQVITLLTAIGAFLFFCFSSRRKVIPAWGLGLIVYSGSVIFCNWFTVLYTGDYVEITSSKYMVVAIFTPLFLLLFGIHAIIFWRGWLETVVAIAVSVFTVTCACIPQSPSINWDFADQDIPDLKAMMKQYGIKDLLTDYWMANITTFLSHGEVSPRGLANDGKIYYWFNTLEWFGKNHPLKDGPRFRMIYAPDPGFSKVFGEPDQIVYTSHKGAVWLYSEEHAIRYNEYFDLLSNKFRDDGHTVHYEASDLPGRGEIQDHSRIAKAGRENDGSLTFGPYLDLEPAHFRVTFHYSYPVPPAPDKLATCDLCTVNSDGVETSDHVNTLPCPNTKPQTFSYEVDVKNRHQSYEMRTFFHESGTLRVDSLDVTYLGN